MIDTIGPEKLDSLLEIGGGTGNHSMRLARHTRQLTVHEIDHDFFPILQEKTSSTPTITCTSLPVEKSNARAHSAACAFFYMLNYLDTQQALVGFLTAIQHRLKNGSFFIADIWNGDFFAETPPHNKVQIKTDKDWRATINTKTVLSPNSRQASMVQSFKIEQETGDTLSFEETYDLMIWRQADIQDAATAAGFGPVRFWSKTGDPIDKSPFLWTVWQK